MGPGLRDRNAGRRELTGVLTGSGGMAPQHSAARLSSTSNIAGPPPATARGPIGFGPRALIQAPGATPLGSASPSTARVGAALWRPPTVGNVVPGLQGSRGLDAGVRASLAATHAPAQRTGACGEPGARVRARPARPSLQARLAAGGRLGPRRPRCPSWPRGVPALPVKA